MNEVLNNIYTRRSIRKFKEQDVPKDLVDEIVKAGTYAPEQRQLYLLHVRKKLSTESATAHAQSRTCFLQHTHLDLVHAGSTS